MSGVNISHEDINFIKCTMQLIAGALHVVRTEENGVDRLIRRIEQTEARLQNAVANDIIAEIRKAREPDK